MGKKQKENSKLHEVSIAKYIYIGIVCDENEMNECEQRKNAKMNDAHSQLQS